jgi:ParB family chromosome partitioning protein
VAKNRLGRGLGALLPDEGGLQEKAAGGGNPAGETLIELEKLKANPGQPRRRFDNAELEELAASIKSHGVIQPVILEEEQDGTYLIIAGERRSRAARLAGLDRIPAVVRNYSSRKRLEVALIENIHRSDLNPVEEAEAYKRLMEEGGLSQDETAERVGKSRSAVANALRLLKLPVPMRESLEEGRISAGHARAILSLPLPAAQERLFKEINASGLSVRAAEKRAAVLADPLPPSPAGAKNRKPRDPQIKTMEDKLIEALGTRVSILGSLEKGRVEIEYYSMEDLDRLYGLLGKD